MLARGTDILIITAGITTEEALRARGALEKTGVSIRHLHINTIKPFEAKALLDHIQSVKVGVITLENHVVTGGIGSLVSETITDAGIGKKLIRLGLKDTFAHGGSRPYLSRYYGLDALALVRSVDDLLGEPTGVTEKDLDAIRVEDVHSPAKAEAL